MTSEEKIKKLEGEVALLRAKMAEVIQRMNQILTVNPRSRPVTIGAAVEYVHGLHPGGSHINELEEG